MNGRESITLELLSKTALQLASLKKQEPALVVDEAYRFLEFCEATLKSQQENKRDREEFETKLASEGIPTSQAIKEITGGTSSYYRERFFNYVDSHGRFRRYAKDFQKKIPRDLIPELKQDYQDWNDYQKTLEAKKKGLKLQERDEKARELIDGVQMISRLPTRESKKTSNKSS